MVEVMVAVGLTSVLLLTDMQRHDNNQQALQRHSSLESAENIPSTIRTWLRNPNVIEYSLGLKSSQALSGTATYSRKKVYTSAQDVASWLSSTTTASHSIQHLRIPNGSSPPNGDTLKLRPGTTTTNTRLIGPPNGDNSDISSNGMDGKGKVYIRAMWIENFSPYFSGYDNSLVTPPPNPPPSNPSPNWKRGTANLKIVVWRLTSSPSANAPATCADGCRQSVYDTPLDLRVTLNNAIPSNNNQIIDGSFGLRCGEASYTSVIDPPNCAPNEFFDITESQNAKTDGTVSIGSHLGRCCRFIQ